MNVIKASVIIPTKGRDQCVRQTLEDLSKQDFANFDIWLVDQNEAPLSALSAHVDKVAFHHEKMPPLGSHAGRNHAIAKTTAPICIFVDDDVRIEKDFVRQHVMKFEQGSYNGLPLGGIAGRVVQPKDGYTEEQMRLMGAPARYNSVLGRVSGNFIGSAPGLVDHVHECNFSAKTDVLRRIGGFNTEFKGNAYFEGADLALKIKALGFAIAYSPDIVLIHLQDGAGGNRVQQKSMHTYWFMRNYGLLNSLHMNKLGLPIYVSYGLAYVLGKALKNRDAELLLQGMSGFLDGIKYFFRKR